MRLSKIDHVFHPSDFTYGDELAFTHALKIALSSEAQLQLLHVKRSDEDLEWDDFPHVRSTLHDWGVLSSTATQQDVAKLGLRVVKVQRANADPLKGIVKYVADHHPELVVLTTHQRHGLDRLLHGSIAEPIARRIHAATLFVPRGVEGFVDQRTGSVRLRNILIPIAATPNPQVAIDAAASLAGTLAVADVHFCILYVGLESDRPRIDIPAKLGWSSGFQTGDGNVVDRILAAARTDGANLIVMATHGHDGFLDALRGSTTERVLRAAPCPVLAVSATH